MPHPKLEPSATLWLSFLSGENKNMIDIKNVTKSAAAEKLDELFWAVLWQPLGLPRNVRHSFRLEGEEFELMAEENGQVVGGLAAVWTGDTELELRHLAVAALAQNRGVGCRLVTELCRIAADKKCQRIHTLARNTSAGFFRKLGFRTASGAAPEHPIFMKHDITFEPMEKIVKQNNAVKS